MTWRSKPILSAPIKRGRTINPGRPKDLIEVEVLGTLRDELDRG